MSLDRKILERIERENLRIKPRWFFAMKDVLFAAGTFFLSILGSLSLALLFEIMKQQGESLTWLNIPYVWIILLGIFLMTGYWLVTKIDSLYRIKFVPIVSMLFFISLSFGYLTFASGKAEKIELELEKIPIYDVIMPIIKKDISLDAVEKVESSNENVNVNDEEKKNDDNIKEDSKSADSEEDDKVNIQEHNFKVEAREENEDDEIKEPEKTDNIDKDEEDSDDSLKGEVKGASKEVVKDDEESGEAEEEVAEEESDSDDEIASSSEDDSEKSKTDTSSDAAEED